MALRAGSLTDADKQILKNFTAIWSFVKLFAGVLYFVFLSGQNTSCYFAAGTVTIVAAMLFLIGNLNKIWWLCVPEVILMTFTAFYLAGQCLYSFGAGIHFYFVDTYDNRGFLFILSGFGYLLVAGVAFFFLFLVAGVLEHVKNYVDSPERPEIVVEKEQKNVEIGGGARKLEEVD